jgi:GalNAc-alpha-(1->4)-GalNAc-alpha-(1->3)-diNAcBac-PP-undecaprenol alpha-1,4-N-acetyl-D-galactosaminyltransferase
MLAIARGLFLNGYRVSIITLSEQMNDHYAHTEEITRVSLNAYGPSKNIFDSLVNNIRRVNLLRTQLKSSRPDVVISFLTETNILTSLALTGLTFKFIACERNNLKAKPRKLFWKLMLSYCFRRATLVTANSKSLMAQLKSRVSPKKLQLVQNPVDQPMIDVALHKKEKTIIFTGRLVAQKNLQTLIQAFGKLKKTHPDWNLKIFGDGPEKHKLISTCNAIGLDPKAVFRGVITNCNTEYLNSSIFVLPSQYEGTPNSLLEAMSFGCVPIVSSSSDGALDYVISDVNGLIFEFNNPECLLQNFMKIINSKTLFERLAKSAQQRVTANTTAQIIKNWQDLILRCHSQ